MFSDFALHERLLKAVAELKFVEPTPVQAAAIPLALQGRDLRVTAQTGSGKTAAFVLPILNRLIGPAKMPPVSNPSNNQRRGANNTAGIRTMTKGKEKVAVEAKAINATTKG